MRFIYVYRDSETKTDGREILEIEKDGESKRMVCIGGIHFFRTDIAYANLTFIANNVHWIYIF